MYQFISVFVWDHSLKSFCGNIFYLQKMKGFQVEDGALVTSVAALLSTCNTGCGLLKK